MGRYRGKKDSKCVGLLQFKLFFISKLIRFVILAATMVRNRPITFIDPKNPEAVVKLYFDSFLVSSQLLNKFLFINGLLFFLNIELTVCICHHVEIVMQILPRFYLHTFKSH